MRTVPLGELTTGIDKVTHDRDKDIEHVCTTNHQEFIGSINKLDKGREDCASLGTEILTLVQSYQESTEKLSAEKKNLVDSRHVRKNIEESSEAIKECLDVLRLANQTHELVAKGNHYGALRALDELQTQLRLRESARYKIGEMIEKSIPATQKMIAEAVMTELNTWLYRIRDVSQYVGEVAFYNVDRRRDRHKTRALKDSQLAAFRVNSPVELVADEMEEYDCLDNDEADVHVDFSPLFEAIHIHEGLGQIDRFRSEYAMTRRRQKDLIIPSHLRINDSEASDLKTLLESIAGFCIIERATMNRTENLRTSADIDELWDSMSTSAISLMNGAAQSINDSDLLFKITGVISLFIQTMESWGFYANGPNKFLMTLFERYVHLLKTRFSDDVKEILSTDDYMPQTIPDWQSFDSIVDFCFYGPPEVDREDVTFPYFFPFSQMYPMCCHDIRQFRTAVFSAPDEYITASTAIDETIRSATDDILLRIHETLMERVRSSQNLAQIVQILINLEYFEKACEELQLELAQTRASRSKAAPVVLNATNSFNQAQQSAKERIFELVNSKIDDLIETAEYDWRSRIDPDEPSNYMTELTQWLQNTMNSVLLGLPPEMKDMIYFDSLNHAASTILELPLDPAVPAVTPAALALFKLDVGHLSSFVGTLSLPTAASAGMLDTGNNAQQNPSVFRRTLDELNQTVALMSSDDPNEFFDISQRSRKYAAVDAQNGALLLDKVDQGKQVAAAPEKPAPAEKLKASDRFGNFIGGFRG